MVSKKKQKQIDELLDIIFLCECVMREADSLHDYEVAEKQLFKTEVELQELERKIKESSQVSR